VGFELLALLLIHGGYRVLQRFGVRGFDRLGVEVHVSSEPSLGMEFVHWDLRWVAGVVVGNDPKVEFLLVGVGPVLANDGSEMHRAFLGLVFPLTKVAWLSGDVGSFRMRRVVRIT